MRNKKGLNTKIKIAAATVTAIFSLASVFTGTYAWFASQNNVIAGGMTIKAKQEEVLQYNLYYLQSFTYNQQSIHGNYSSTIASNCGYEVDYSNATFAMVSTDDESGYDPTDISNLWPAHRLTFALVITSKTMTKFSITDWSENEGNESNNAAMVNSSQYVRLSWAINIYGYAYSVADTNDTDDLTDVATGYTQNYYNYINSNSKRDRFPYSQDSLAPVPPTSKTELTVVGDEYAPVPADASGYKTIVYFTIEFSNDNSTYYRRKQDGYYERSTAGNSNCYEKLQLDALSFTIE